VLSELCVCNFGLYGIFFFLILLILPCDILFAMEGVLYCIHFSCVVEFFLQNEVSPTHAVTANYGLVMIFTLASTCPVVLTVTYSARSAHAPKGVLDSRWSVPSSVHMNIQTKS
jgi:hypothetical protein